MRKKLERCVWLGLRLYLGGIFVLAALPKIMDPASFYKGVYMYGLVPEVFLPWFAVMLP